MIVRILRAVVFAAALVVLWYHLVDARPDGSLLEGMDGATWTVLAVLLGACTLVWGLGLRWERVRAAGIPIEAGVVVAVLVRFAAPSGTEVDTAEDHLFVGLVVGAIATVALGVVAPLVRDRDWGAGAIVGCAVLAYLGGVAVTPVADHYGGGGSGDMAAMLTDRPDEAPTVLDRALQTDGSVRLSLTDDLETFAPFGGVGPVRATLGALPDGSLRLEIARDDPTRRVVGELHRQDVCGPPGGGAPDAYPRGTERFELAGGVSSVPIASTRSDDLPRTMSVTWGTGAPLAPVACERLYPAVVGALVANGLVGFAAECVRGAAPSADGRWSATSFSGTCRARWRELDLLARSRVQATRAAAEEVATCIQQQVGGDEDVVAVKDVHDGWFAVVPRDARADVSWIPCGMGDAVAMPGASVPVPAPVDVVVS